MMTGANYRVLGFLFSNGRRHFTDPAEYADWVGVSYSKTLLKEDLHFGRFPEGLILSSPDGVMVVSGHVGGFDQTLVPLMEIIKNYKPKPNRKITADDIADHLLIIRGAMNLTQKGMANYLGLSTGSILRIEEGYRNFRKGTECKLMKLRYVYQNKIIEGED